MPLNPNGSASSRRIRLLPPGLPPPRVSTSPDDPEPLGTPTDSWSAALALLHEKGVDDKFLTLVQGAVDQCLDGTHEAHDLVLVDSAFQTQRALLLLNEPVVSEIRSMVDEASVPAHAQLVYDFVQFEPRLRRAHTRVVATQH